jgi:hypothetical protein
MSLLLIASSLELVRSELYITTSTAGWSSSGGNLEVQLRSSAGAVKASAALAKYFYEGALTTWNPNGVGFEAGNEIRFRWSSTDGWRLSGLSLEGFTLQGRSAPFWMDEQW